MICLFVTLPNGSKTLLYANPYNSFREIISVLDLSVLDPFLRIQSNGKQLDKHSNLLSMNLGNLSNIICNLSLKGGMPSKLKIIFKYI